MLYQVVPVLHFAFSAIWESYCERRVLVCNFDEVRQWFPTLISWQ